MLQGDSGKIHWKVLEMREEYREPGKKRLVKLWLAISSPYYRIRGDCIHIYFLLCTTVIDEEMNESLCREFETSEVAIALQQMAPLKAPGLDGMPPLFYQHFWSTVN